MTVAHSPSANTIGARKKNLPSRSRTGARSRNTITAMQVIAVTNSYMFPHGTRCSDNPRVRIPRYAS